jgi:hypothetical protein
MNNPLFYQRVVQLDREQHSKLKLRPLGSLAFAADTALVPLLSSEFVHAAREYPIAFMRNADQHLVPVVLTGVPGGRNVYVDAAGQWQARYVPAYVRRYPFVFAESGTDQLTVCFDEACEALNESEGQPLFEETGEAGPALGPVLALLTEYQRQALLTQAFTQRLEASGLLMEANAKADLADGRSLALTGFWIVDESRLKGLPEVTLKDWFATGELGLVYAHLLSLGNFLELVRRQPEAQSAPQPQPAVTATGKAQTNKQRNKR